MKKNKKPIINKPTIVLIICGALFIIYLTFFGWYVFDPFSFNRKIDKTPENTINSQSYELENIEKINLSFIASRFDIILTDDDSLKVVQYSNKELPEEYIFEMIADNNELTVQEAQVACNFIFCLNNNSVYDIYLPKSYQKSLKIESVSSEIEILSELNYKKLEVNSVSGKITLDGMINTDQFNVKTVSGAVNVNSVKALESNIETTSGKITVSSIEGTNTLKSVSGSINISRAVGSIDLRTTSGSVNVNNYLLQKASNIRTISGRVNVNLTKDSNCELRINTTSGHIEVPNNSYIVGNPPYPVFEIGTTSGSVTITVD